MIDYYETKEHPITKRMVLDAYKEIRTNGHAAGVDEVSLEQYKENLVGNLYKLWNRLTSGSYFPSLVREKLIDKSSGGKRMLGIPTVEDRIAQQVVKSYLEPKVEPTFHADSYGYRPKRHAHQAVKMATARCFKHSWVIDIDIKSFFDTIDHDRMMEAVRRYSQEKWVLMYIERWLKVGMLKEDGSRQERKEGTPQGGVISPLLANIFLHFAFDKWMEKYHSNIKFERYCDDIIVHCHSEKQANFILAKIRERMSNCKLALNQEKTKLVLSKSSYNKGEKGSKHRSFDFLGFTLQPTLRKTQFGIRLLMLPTMSRKARNNVRQKIREMKIHRSRRSIYELADKINVKTRGWINYCASRKGEYVQWDTSPPG